MCNLFPLKYYGCCVSLPLLYILVSQELFPLFFHMLSALGTAQEGGRIEKGEFKKTTRKNYSTHCQIHLPILKQWPHSSLDSGQPHSIQNKACCWRLQNINNSKVCAAAGGRTTTGSTPQGWHKEWICFRLHAKGTGKLDFTEAAQGCFSPASSILRQAFAQTRLYCSQMQVGSIPAHSPASPTGTAAS